MSGNGYTLPRKLRELVPYAPLSGSYRIRLDANESFLSPPPELMEAMALEPDRGCSLLESMVLEKNLPEQDNYTGIIISCS